MSDDFQGAPPAPEAPQAPPMAAPVGDGSGPASDTSKLLAVFGYLTGIVALIAILIEPYKDEKFVKHHAVQALGLSVVMIVASIVNVIPILGQIVWVILSIVVTVFAIMGAIKAWNGELYEIPVVYNLVKQYI